jgi:hypothetical protein
VVHGVVATTPLRTFQPHLALEASPRDGSTARQIRETVSSDVTSRCCP